MAIPNSTSNSRRNEQSLASRISKKRPSDEGFGYVGDQKTDNIVTPNPDNVINLAEAKKQKEVARTQSGNMGTTQDAVDGQVGNYGKTSEQIENEKMGQALSPEAAATLPKGIADKLNPNKKGKEGEQDNPRDQSRDERRDEFFRRAARLEALKSGVSDDKLNKLDFTGKSQKLKEKAEMIINALKKFGTITDGDAIRLLDKKIVEAQTWGNTILTWTIDIALVLWGMGTAAILFITTLGTGGIGSALTIPLSMANAFFLYLVNLITRIILFIYNKFASKKSLIGLEEIRSLQKIITGHNVKVSGWMLFLETIPVINIVPWTQIGNFLNKRFLRRVAVATRKAIVEANNL